MATPAIHAVNDAMTWGRVTATNHPGNIFMNRKTLIGFLVAVSSMAALNVQAGDWGGLAGGGIISGAIQAAAANRSSRTVVVEKRVVVHDRASTPARHTSKKAAKDPSPTPTTTVTPTPTPVLTPMPTPTPVPELKQVV